MTCYNNILEDRRNNLYTENNVNPKLNEKEK